MSEYALKPTTVHSDWVKLPDLKDLNIDEYTAFMGPGQQWLEPGYYDQDGNLLGDKNDKEKPLERLRKPAPPETRLVIEYAGVNLVWGVFERQLAPGERGDMLFKNTPGSGPITPFFNEWDTVGHLPRVADAFFALVASMRGKQIAKIAGVNTHNSHRWAAAGMIVSQMVKMPTT